MTPSAETHEDANLTDPSPKRKPGRPKGSKDKKPRKNARRAASRAARVPSRPRGTQEAPSHGLQVNARWREEPLARLDAFASAHEMGRSEAMREAALSAIARWERLSRQKPPQKPAALAFWVRIRLAWGVLSGKYSAAHTRVGWVLQEGSNTD